MDSKKLLEKFKEFLDTHSGGSKDNHEQHVESEEPLFKSVKRWSVGRYLLY